MVFETLFVAQSMGQTIEYVLEMGIDAYNNMVEFLKYQKEEADKMMEGREISEVKTFR